MALTIATPVTIGFNVIGDGSSTVIAVNLGNEPFNLPTTILRVTDLTVTGIAGLTATRVFTGATVTLTFSAGWIGSAFVSLTVLI